MHIPQEVHDLILAHLDPIHLSHYRLVNSNFAHAATSAFFAHLRFNTRHPSYASQLCLKDLAYISSQERLRHCVRSLSWFSYGYGRAQYLDDLPREELEELRDMLPGHSRDMIQRAALLNREHPGTKAAIGVLILQALLVNFPNLYKLHVDARDGIGPEEERGCREDPAYLLRGEYEMVTLLTAANQAGCPVTKFSIQTLDSYRPLFRQNIWPALAKVCSGLTTLDLDVNFCLSLEERREHFGEGENMVPAEYDIVYSDMSTAEAAASFRTFLSTLRDLRSLTLDFEQTSRITAEFDNSDSSMTEPVFMELLPSGHIWSSLQKFELWDPSTTVAFLKQFLDDHKASLNKVRLHSIRFPICSVDEDSCAIVRHHIATEMELEESKLQCYICTYR